LLPNRYYRFTAETFNFHDFNRQIRLMHFACSQEGETPPVDLDEASQTFIRSAEDVLVARRVGRSRALSIGFGAPDASLVAAAISEVARNILEHAQFGEITIRDVSVDGRRGLTIIARDGGPGIHDVESVVHYGRAGGAGLGVGLPGARLLVDEFSIESAIGAGTTVTMTKWMAS
jgi:serine/threonine-protein kinase RsbT